MEVADPASRFDPAAIERARKLFAGPCDFFAGADSEARLPPPEAPEIAFAGRSNVGKSSLVNALTGRKTLARVSNTPGRTQQINFFLLSDRLRLVDLPGYGYAKVSKAQRADWGELIRLYLRGRVTLLRALVLVDGRHGLKDSDHAILKLLDEAAVSTEIVLTKADKLSDGARAARSAEVAAALKKHPAAAPEPHLTSAHKGAGIDALRAHLAGLAGWQSAPASNSSQTAGQE